ncbi:hypothetical protein [Actinacidiphila paucisporea]|uniref:Uncharacterized protein n=1 Tax=Actinacidiphila paucisporea TaxID=310782 RepID=A0A1M6YL59_9ACTN|nr:hypothetical protein [Actinacidiphila paucisporea]SHL18978.1 hypothetical protein SAMN05216499_10330 [Actinacidiphila paucisporea]
MPEIQQSVEFKAVVAQTSAVLLTRGVEVEPVAVRDVVALMVRSVAERMNLDPEEAIHMVVPETVADAIIVASDPDREGAEGVHSVRPVRVDARRAVVPVRVAGRLVMAAAQAGKYARLNGNGRVADQALDLATEIGAALSSTAAGDDDAELPVGVLTELAGITETVATRVERDGWSICPCDEDHDQAEADARMPATLRADAALARRWSAG